jgi:hypothetical protein
MCPSRLGNRQLQTPARWPRKEPDCFEGPVSAVCPEPIPCRLQPVQPDHARTIWTMEFTSTTSPVIDHIPQSELQGAWPPVNHPGNALRRVLGVGQGDLDAPGINRAHPAAARRLETGLRIGDLQVCNTTEREVRNKGA